MQIKAAFTIINDYKSVSIPRQRSRYGVLQTKFYARQREESLKEMSNFLCYYIQECNIRVKQHLRCDISVACPHRVRVGVGFHSGQARPTEVFKLVPDTPHLELRSPARAHS